jgi:hypothetical protein
VPCRNAWRALFCRLLAERDNSRSGGALRSSKRGSMALAQPRVSYPAAMIEVVEEIDGDHGCFVRSGGASNSLAILQACGPVIRQSCRAGP